MTNDDLNAAICHLNSVSIDGSATEKQDASERVKRLRERRTEVRAVATERVLDRRYRQTTVTDTPYGTLTHAITGQTVRPATARELGDFEAARRNGRHCILIGHVHNGRTWEEPYVVIATKTLEMRG